MLQLFAFSFTTPLRLPPSRQPSLPFTYSILHTKTFTAMNSPLTRSNLTISTSLAVLLQIAGVALFLFGFFPVKPTLPGFSGPESYEMPSCDGADSNKMVDVNTEQLGCLYKNLSDIPPVYDRLILMVIDGLPAEFILGKDNKPPTKTMIESMSYTQYLLSNCEAIGFHAKAAPPTVTMPRLKAMVSGAIGGFLDVAFNFNTKAFLDDNLLDQLSRIGWKLVMLGDETWIKLFPNLFFRQDGVSSFFVKDTVQVDFNVSRHLDVELTNKDWNLLILHYLGLDHVGHIGGRQSTLMAPKLKEMDDVIKAIHTQNILPNKNSNSQTLLVVVSDHGMTDEGNHGGSSYEETDSLALFIGLEKSKCDKNNNNNNNDEAYQVDIAPTLALLLGVPIPKNNIGVILTEVFHSFTDEQKLRSLELNSWQLFRLLQANLPGLCCEYLSSFSPNLDFENTYSISNTKQKFCDLFSKAVSAHNSWRLQNTSDLISNNVDYFEIASESYIYFLRNASEWLSHKATDKPIHILLCAITLMLISCILLITLTFRSIRKAYFKPTNNPQNPEEIFIFISVLFHAIGLLSSSFVEEEQYTWHFFTSTLYLIFLFRTIQSLIKRPNNTVELISPVILTLIFGRILRAWHQGGINWAHFPDIAKAILQSSPSNIKYLQIISVIAIFALFSLSVFSQKSRSNVVIFIWVNFLICAYLVILQSIGYNASNIIPINQWTTSIPQIVYYLGGISVILSLLFSPWIYSIRSKKDIKGDIKGKIKRDYYCWNMKECIYLIGSVYTAFWCIFQFLVQKPVNAFPVLLIYMQIRASVYYFEVAGPIRKVWVEVAAIHFLGLTGHFGLGNTNSLATIDVAGAFIGISSYSTTLSGILMFGITYASPILSSLSMIIYISTRIIPQKEKFEWRAIWERIISFPILVPLVINSVSLTSFTVVLLLMRNHLFIWSVFSPKYLYLCASTVSVYIGVIILSVTVLYTCSSFSFMKRNKQNLN
ncbi:hypothetical protein LUZ60_002683 [Juncus effusus]|nr:hypothetical protein LUZ60_002683 [Juncus effusus]